MNCTNDKSFSNFTTDEESGQMIELFFDWLIDIKVKVAVKACASQTLFNLSQRFTWVAEELQNQLNYLMQNGSPAIQATGRRLLSELKGNLYLCTLLFRTILTMQIIAYLVMM